MVLGELQAAFHAGSRREANEERLTQFLSATRVRVVGIDEATVPPYAAIHYDLKRRGTLVGLNDVWIAATAYQHGLSILTLDRDFQKIPQVLVHFVDSPHA